MLHAKALAVTVAYDMYLECAEGSLSNEWKQEKPVDFYTFREKLAKQMVLYSPLDRKYPGDEKFRVATRQPKKKRKFANVASEINSSAASAATTTSNRTTITREGIVAQHKRLCGDLTFLYAHVQSVKPTDSSGRICVVCGKRCYSVCVSCGEAMHRFPSKKSTEVPCFYHHHNTSFFGLSKRDATTAGTRIKDWTFPSPNRMGNHRKDILCLLQPRAIALPPQTPRAAPVTRAVSAPVVVPATATNDLDDSALPPIDMNRVI